MKQSRNSDRMFSAKPQRSPYLASSHSHVFGATKHAILGERFGRGEVTEQKGSGCEIEIQISTGMRKMSWRKVIEFNVDLVEK